MQEQNLLNSDNSLHRYGERLANIGNDFDIGLFLLILKQCLKWMLLFFFIGALSAYLYLRYTHPLYEASTVLQLTSQNTAKRVLNVENIFEREISGEIELLRSNAFLTSAFSSLQLDIGYFAKGKVLNYEQYIGAPYSVKTRNVTGDVFETPVYVSFPAAGRIFTSYTIDGKMYEKALDSGVWCKLEHAEVLITINDFSRISSQQSQFQSDPYFFVIHNPSNIMQDIYTRLDIRILNEAAKTISVSYHDNNPRKAMDVVNAIANEFVEHDVSEKGESAEKILAFVDDQLALVYDKLRNSESKIQSYKKQNKMAGNRDFITVFINRLDDFENQIIDLELEEQVLSEIEKTLTGNQNIDVYNLVSSLMGTDYQSEVSEMLKKLQNLLSEKEQRMFDVAPNSEVLKPLEHQIGIQKKLIIASIKSLKAKVTSRQESLKKKVQEVENKFTNLPATELEYARILRMFSINERFYNMLLEKKAEFSISKAGYVSKNVILQYSSTPEIPISPQKQIVTTVCFTSAGIASILLLLLLYLLHNEITSLNDIIKTTNAPILGIVPEFRKDIPVSQLLVEMKPKSLIAESFRSIRTNLQFISAEPGPKIVAVTSTVSGEGKTFIALNLACILAFTDKKVVVIDMDLRKPKIHLGFNVPNTKGISTILINKNTPDECIFKSNVNNLDLITAGPVPPNPSELIISRKMEELLSFLKSRYDVIVIDTPPVGIVTDGISCMGNADYPIYIFRANFSKKHYIKNIDRLINESKIKNLSLVLNGIDTQSQSGSRYGSNYGYGYGYSYGYGYYDEEQDMKPKTLLRRVFAKG